MSKAEESRQLLENPIFIEAFQNVREGVISQIEATPIDDAEARNQLGLQLAALSGVKFEIQSYIDTQMLDEDELSNKV